MVLVYSKYHIYGFGLSCWYMVNSFHHRLPFFPSKTSILSITDFHSFHHRLPFFPSQTSILSIADFHSFHHRLPFFPSQTCILSITDFHSFHHRLPFIPSQTSIFLIKLTTTHCCFYRFYKWKCLSNPQKIKLKCWICVRYITVFQAYLQWMANIVQIIGGSNLCTIVFIFLASFCLHSVQAMQWTLIYYCIVYLFLVTNKTLPHEKTISKCLLQLQWNVQM